MPKNRDNIYDPDPGKGFTRAKLPQLQEIEKSQLDTAPQHTSAIKKKLFNEEKEISKMNLIPDVGLDNQKGFDHRLNGSIHMSQWPVHIKLILLLTKIIKDDLSYSKGVQKNP